MTLRPPPQTEQFIQTVRKLSPSSRAVLRGIMLTNLARRRSGHVSRSIPHQSHRANHFFPKTVTFVLTACTIAFTLFAILPTHPMSIPTAIGGGCSLAIWFLA